MQGNDSMVLHAEAMCSLSCVSLKEHLARVGLQAPTRAR